MDTFHAVQKFYFFHQKIKKIKSEDEICERIKKLESAISKENEQPTNSALGRE